MFHAALSVQCQNLLLKLLIPLHLTRSGHLIFREVMILNVRFTARVGVVLLPARRLPGTSIQDPF